MTASSRSGLHVQLAALPDEVPRVRRAVRRWLRSAGNRCDWSIAELLVSELVTNALVHALPPLELRVKPLGAHGVRIEVFDAAADRRPTHKAAPLDADGGRGIEIVAALASRWGTESAISGKLVWAELD
ncbi:MAG TPA: ATP-binding protein [Jiangellaceae bacterium]|nr:ATP-binding protein [Jiangellaceae bacterium]